MLFPKFVTKSLLLLPLLLLGPSSSVSARETWTWEETFMQKHPEIKEIPLRYIGNVTHTTCNVWIRQRRHWHQKAMGRYMSVVGTDRPDLDLSKFEDVPDEVRNYYGYVRNIWMDEFVRNFCDGRINEDPRFYYDHDSKSYHLEFSEHLGPIGQKLRNCQYDNFRRMWGQLLGCHPVP